MAGNMELIGVYRLPVTDALVAEHAEVLYDGEASPDELAQLRSELEAAVLVEVLVSGADAAFDVSDFGQAAPAGSEEEGEVAWAEAFLAVDGERLLVPRGEALPRGETWFRVAFYMPQWRAEQPLFTSYGDLPGSAPTAMPQRLWRLVPYESGG